METERQREKEMYRKKQEEESASDGAESQA